MKNVVNVVSLMALARFAASVDVAAASSAVSTPSAASVPSAASGSAAVLASSPVPAPQSTSSSALAIQAADNCEPKLRGIPNCALPCFHKATLEIDCGGQDYACRCQPKNAAIVEGYLKNNTCVEGYCGDPGLLRGILKVFKDHCACINHGGLPGPSDPSSTPTPTPTPTPTSTPSATPSSPSGSPTSPVSGCPCQSNADAIPDCGKSCIVDGAAKVGCGPQDYQCQCAKLEDIKAAAFNCFSGACGDDAFRVITALGSLCSCIADQPADSCKGGAPPVSTGTPSPPASTTTPSPSSSIESPPASTETPSPSLSTGTPSPSPTTESPSATTSTPAPSESTEAPPATTNTFPASTNNSEPPISSNSDIPGQSSALTSTDPRSSLSPADSSSATSASSVPGPTDSSTPSPPVNSESSAGPSAPGMILPITPEAVSGPAPSTDTASTPSSGPSTDTASTPSSGPSTNAASTPSSGLSRKPSSSTSTGSYGKPITTGGRTNTTRTANPSRPSSTDSTGDDGIVHAGGARIEIGIAAGVVGAVWIVAAIL
ncbi:hypothetical protein ACQRIT_007564 [Beauveria bassiana]